jgi:Flp pilus assembly protein TadG
MKTLKRKQRGSALVEFALTFPLLFGVFSGSFEFGYAFYAYNTLVNAAREGARYASLKPYDSATSTPSTAFQSAVQNMVVYGDPAGGAAPILHGLSASNVQLNVLMAGGTPMQMTVSITGLSINIIFGTFQMNGKPSVSFPYLGIPTPP